MPVVDRFSIIRNLSADRATISGPNVSKMKRPYTILGIGPTAYENIYLILPKLLYLKPDVPKFDLKLGAVKVGVLKLL